MGHLSFKTPRSARLRGLSRKASASRAVERLQKLLQARQSEYEAMPQEQRQAMMDAYRRHCEEADSFEPSKVAWALADLGYCAVTQEERRTIRRICTEAILDGSFGFTYFCFELIPRVRAALKEARREALRMEFRMYDKDFTNSLDIFESRQIFERLCTFNLDDAGFEKMEAYWATAIVDCSDANGEVLFDGFEVLVENAREQHQTIVTERTRAIQLEHELDDVTLGRHSCELVSLHASFERACRYAECNGSTDGSRVDIEGLLVFLSQFDLLPRGDEQQQALVDCMSGMDLSEDTDLFTFEEALGALRAIRRSRRDRDCDKLRGMFRHFDRNGDAVLEIGEVSTVLCQFGLQPRSRTEQVRLKALLEEVDEDASGDICINEFPMLVEKLRVVASIIEQRKWWVVAKELGLPEVKVLELRRLFCSLDEQEDGMLDAKALHQAVSLLRIRISDPEDVHAAVVRHDTSNRRCLDFPQFLRFFLDLSAADG